MRIDIDTYIDLFKSLSDGPEKMEMSEQDAAAGGATTQNTNKRGSNWNELYSLKRGKANMLGLKGEKWSTGLTRGVANQLPGSGGGGGGA
jgi:hypothetical protein